MDSDYDLSLLLTKWNLQHLFDHFKKHMIDIDVLKILKTHHITKLFEDLPIGQQAKFEFNLEKWNKQFNSSEILPVCQHITTTEQKIPTVTEILSNTRNGKDIQNYYNNNKTLHDEQRNLLINTITKYIESKNITCSLSDCMEIEKQICNIFPTEKLEFYTNGKRGKIYNKLANYKRFSKNALKVDEPEVTQGLSESVEDYTLIIEVLRSSKIKQDEFDIYWQKCAPLRFQQITNSENTCEIFKLWPEYTKPSGHLLIDIDFVLKYPVAKNFEERWPYFAEDLLFILKTRISCSLISKKLLQTERIDEDSKMFTILWYCHNLFPPQLKISTDENGAKYKKKFTIADSQESFAVVIFSRPVD
ncbi:uncharacterized protein LOC111687876 [Lucilia cuprina]|uniref:uncharacterized protein LOC111687876 n=1 Tax=Lucilia cuprina TaxID=7375 RepID=UPI001F05ED1D|nr:uncharacterized protein LOC111687876 [Lucilia cuprina]